MAVLKGKEAVGYFDRVLSVLHPDQHPFSQIPLISAMLSVQKVFVQRLLETGREELAIVDIHPSGLPTLPSWYVDISHAFSELGRVRGTRAQALLPMIQDVLNADFDGIKKTGKEVAQVFEADYGLTKVLEPMPEEQKRYLKNLSDGKNGSSPLGYGEGQPGLLIVNDTPNVYQIYSGESIRRLVNDRVSNIPTKAGLKFVDAPTNSNSDQPQRAPALLYAAFDPRNQIQYVRVATGNVDLNGRVVKRVKNAHQSILDLGIDLKEAIKRNEEYYSPEDQRTILLFATIANSVRPELRQVMLDMDSSSKGNDFDNLMTALPKLNKSISSLLNLGAISLAAEPLSGRQVQLKARRLATELKSLYDSLPSDEARHEIQVAVGRVVKPLQIDAQKQAKALESGTPSRPLIEAPKPVVKPAVPVQTPVPIKIEPATPKSFWDRLTRRGK